MGAALTDVSLGPSSGSGTRAAAWSCFESGSGAEVASEACDRGEAGAIALEWSPVKKRACHTREDFPSLPLAYLGKPHAAPLTVLG